MRRIIVMFTVATIMAAIMVLDAGVALAAEAKGTIEVKVEGVLQDAGTTGEGARASVLVTSDVETTGNVRADEDGALVVTTKPASV